MGRKDATPAISSRVALGILWVIIGLGLGFRFRGIFWFIIVSYSILGSILG